MTTAAIRSGHLIWMSRCCPFRAVAIKGLLIVLLSAPAFGQTPGNNLSTQQQSPAPVEALAFPQDPAPRDYRALCEDPKTRDYADLCQQWRMAEAAIKQANLVQTQVWINTIEMALLLGALGASIAATLLTLRTSQRHLRAYVTAMPEHLFSFGEGTPPSFTFKLTNKGSTPAYRVRHRSAITTLPQPLPPGTRPPELSGNFSSESAIFPTQEFVATPRLDAPFSTEEIESIKAERALIYVYGEVEYYDTFKRRRRTSYCLYVSADAETMMKISSNYTAADLKVVFRFAPMGNEAT